MTSRHLSFAFAPLTARVFARPLALAAVCLSLAGSRANPAHAQSFSSGSRLSGPNNSLGGDFEPPLMTPPGRMSTPGQSGGRRFAVGETPANETANTGGSAVLPPRAAQIDMGQIRRVRVAGELLTETPLRVGNVDMLAPAISQMPRLGATVTQVAPENIPGNPSTPTDQRYFQINLSSGPPIVLAPGVAVAYVKGEERQMRAAPLLIDGKIWLPLYSLAPLLGAALRLEPDGTLNLNPTIQSVQLFPVPSRNTFALQVKASAPLPQGSVLMGTMDGPPRLYLDFPGFSMGFDAAGSTDQRVVADGVGNVRAVRAGLFQTFPDTTRLVLDLRQMSSGVAQPMPDSTTFTLVLIPQGSNPSPGPVTIPDLPQDSQGDQGNQAPEPPDPGYSPGGRPLTGWTIVVDAGHGGHDTGARGARSNEKSLTLDISSRLRNRLRDLGANVLMSRDGDYFITLQGRSDFANTRRANLFVSVHINASVNRNSSGTETFFWTAHSQPLARAVHRELARATGLPNRGTSQARFWVIRKTYMPSILTETAFISNPREEALLMQPQFRQRVAAGIAQGIVNYVRDRRR